jgi:PAS domain S-box-containing protein
MTFKRIVPLSEYHRLPQEAQSSDFYKRLLEVVCNNATLALFIMDEQQQCVYMNPAAETLTGFQLSETKGRALHDVIHHTRPDGRPYPLCECPIDQAFPQNNREQGEEVFVHKDGHFYPVAYTASPIREGDRVTGTIIEVRDITQDKRTEQARQEALQREQNLRAKAEATQQQIAHLLEHMTDAFVAFDRQWRYTYVNPAALQLLQKTSEELIGKNVWEEVFPSEVGGFAYQTLHHAVEKQVSVAWEEFGLPVQRWLDVRAYPSPEGIALYFQDITDRKQVELEREQLLERERQYMRQLQGLTTAALAINSALSVEQVLQVITEQAASIIGAHQSVTSMTMNQNWAQAINAVYLSDKYARWQNYDEKPDGTGIYARVCQLNRPMRLTQAELEAHPHWQGFGKEATNHPPLCGWLAAPLVGRNGTNIGLIQLSDKQDGEFTEADEVILVQLAQMASVAVENAQLYEAERQARSAAEAAWEEAQAANRIKDEFLAVVSHELRSPLNPILGWAKLLRNRQLDEQQTTRALEVIERNAQMQAQLISDLLDVSRILRGKLSLETQPVDLASTIQSAMETVRLAAEAKSIPIRTVFDSSVGKILGDAARIQQVVWNLLSNAVKFTPEGGQVEVRLERVQTTEELNSASDRSAGQANPERANPDQANPDQANPDQANQGRSFAQIVVRDTGKGIPADFLPYVFDHFRQESSATTRRFGGLGLGLAIVRYLVELHGGTVQAESLGEGQGATFVVQLPLMQQQQPLLNQVSSPVETSPDLQGMKILVVDDDDNTREFVAFLLELHQATVIAVNNAHDALTQLPHFQPDILLSDIGMPNVDGYMLMQQVRALSPEQGGRVPAIALTAYAGEIDYQQALAAGFQLHVTKPIEPQVLIQAISTLHAAREAISSN